MLLQLSDPNSSLRRLTAYGEHRQLLLMADKESYVTGPQSSLLVTTEAHCGPPNTPKAH